MTPGVGTSVSARLCAVGEMRASEPLSLFLDMGRQHGINQRGIRRMQALRDTCTGGPSLLPPHLSVLTQDEPASLPSPPSLACIPCRPVTLGTVVGSSLEAEDLWVPLGAAPGQMTDPQ